MDVEELAVFGGSGSRPASGGWRGLKENHVRGIDRNISQQGKGKSVSNGLNEAQNLNGKLSARR